MSNITADYTIGTSIRQDKHTSIIPLYERILIGLLFTLLGGLIMIVFKPWGKQYFLPSDNYLWRIGLSGGLLLATLILRRSTRLERHSQLMLAMFILSVALSLDWVFGNFLFDTLGMSDITPAGWALPKLNDLFVIACVIIVLTRLSGGSFSSLYIQKGNLKLGLIIGLSTFIVAAAGSIPMAGLLFKAENLTVEMVLPWVPWLLIAVLANGALEELAFRGLFLKKLEPFFGKFVSVALVAIVFTLLHQGATYTSQEYIFLSVTFPLALLWGYVIQKTDSLWGSILFHAGMDIPIFLGIFANLPE